MHIIKPFNQSIMTRVIDEGGQYYLVVTVFTFFPFNKKREIYSDFLLWQFAPLQLGNPPILDMGMPKVRGEAMVYGSCHAFDGKKTTGQEVRIRVDELEKKLHVYGDRYWLDEQEKRFSDPVPFQTMPMDWEHAYGGKSEPCNPRGKGAVAVPHPSGQTVRPLPNVEDPANPIFSPDDAPLPAGFRAMEIQWPQRRDKCGTFDNAWLEHRHPGLPADADWTVYNAAPEDQQIDGFFRGDEDFEIVGMHPDKHVVTGHLPSMVTRCFLNEREGEAERFREIPLHVDTVWLFPHEEKAILAHRGLVPVDTEDNDDATHLVIGFDWLDEERRPAEHFHGVLETLRAGEEALLPWETEAKLVPPDFEPPLKAMIEDPEIKKAFVGEGIFARNQMARAEEETARLRQELSDMGLDPVEYLPETLPTPEEASKTDMHAIIEQIQAQAKEAAEKAAKAQEEAKALLKATGLDPEKLQPHAGAPSGILDTPPGELVATLKDAGMEVPEGLEAVLPEFENALAMMQDLQKQNAQLGLHLMDPPAPLSKARSLELRRLMVERHREGRALKDIDFSGADLSGVDIPGADLAETRLTGANLRGAILKGACLREASLAHADLSGAVLEDVDATAANFGKANLQDARLLRAKLRDAVFQNTLCDEANLTGADLRETLLLEWMARGADLREVNLTDNMVLQSDLTGARLGQAKLGAVLFVEAKLSGLDAAGAEGEAVKFVRSDVRDSKWTCARLPKFFAGQGSDFTGAAFDEAVLTESFLGMLPLDGATFRKADLRQANLIKSRLMRSNFRLARAEYAVFRGANLEGADLTSIDLREGSLHASRLVSARLRGANLYGADLQKAVFGETDLRDTILYKTILSKWQPS